MTNNHFAACIGAIVCVAVFIVYVIAWLAAGPSCSSPLGLQLLASLEEKPGDWQVESQDFFKHKSGAKIRVSNEGADAGFWSSGWVEQRLDRACGDEIYAVVKPRRDGWNDAQSKEIGW